MLLPDPLHRLIDVLAVTTHGGVRLRLRRAGTGLVPTLTGRLRSPPESTLLGLVAELGVDRPGTIDIAPRSTGAWRVRTRGPLASASLEQRLRNALGSWSPRPPPGGGPSGSRRASGGG